MRLYDCIGYMGMYTTHLSMNAVVTGSNRGIGLELCKQLAQKKKCGDKEQERYYSSIYALCRKSSKELDNLAAAAAVASSSSSSWTGSSSSSRIIIVEDINVTNEEQSKMILQSTFRSCSDHPIPIHLLVHNAGGYAPPPRPDNNNKYSTFQDLVDSQSLENVTAETMNWCWKLNSLAPLLLTQALLPNLKAAAAAVAAATTTTLTADAEAESTVVKIIIMTSRMASIANNNNTSGGGGGHYGYRASKAAVNMIRVSLAQDLCPNSIAVGLIHPGIVKGTGIHHGLVVVDNEQADENKRRNDEHNAQNSVKGVLQAIEQTNLQTTGSFWDANYGFGVMTIPS